MSTLVKGDTVPISFIGTAADVLKQYPNSPYTAFLVTTQDQVESYAQHCARLVDGLGILVAADSTNSLATVDVGSMSIGSSRAEQACHKTLLVSRTIRCVNMYKVRSGAALRWRCQLAEPTNNLKPTPAQSWSLHSLTTGICVLWC